MNYFPSVKWGTARQTPTLTNDNQQYYGWSLKVYTSKMLPFKKKRKQTFIDSHKHTPQTHKYQYICCMVYMRYSLCLIFYCIQYGTAQTLNSEVQAQELPTGAWNSVFPHIFHPRRGSSGRGKRKFPIYKGKQWTGKQSPSMINDRTVIT